MDESTKRLIAGLLTFLVGLAVGMATVYFFRGPERTSVDPIVVETGSGSDDEDARPGKSPGRGRNKKEPPRERPNAPPPSRPSDDSEGGAVPVPPAPPPAGGGGDDDDDDAGDDDDDDGTDD